jgi:hypothetical protein
MGETLFSTLANILSGTSWPNLGAFEARIDAWHARALLTLYPDTE